MSMKKHKIVMHKLWLLQLGSLTLKTKYDITVFVRACIYAMNFATNAQRKEGLPEALISYESYKP